MANVVTHAQRTTKTWQRQHEAIRTTVKDLNDVREVSGPMPISITRPRRDSASTGSLLFEMDLSASWRSCTKLSPAESALEDRLPLRTNGGVFRTIEQSLTLSTDLEKRIVQSFTLLKGSCESENELDLELLCKKMEFTGFKVRLVGQEKLKKGTPGSEFATVVCCPFLLILGCDGIDGDLPLQDPSPCILDPYFKSQFEIQHPSRTYSSIMEHLPEAFVGSLGRLEVLVKALCREMHGSFHESGLPVPPWRVYSAIIPKWTVPCQTYKQQEEYLFDAEIVGST